MTIAFIVFLSVFFLSASYAYGQSNSARAQLNGFWETPPEFNNESGLSLCTLYIGEHQSVGGQPIYILMVEDDEDTLLINEPAVMNVSGWPIKSQDCYTYSITLSELETDLWPTQMTMRHYPDTSKIILSAGDNIYAVFYKNPVLSELNKVDDVALNNFSTPEKVDDVALNNFSTPEKVDDVALK
jgi:hypothetical protein